MTDEERSRPSQPDSHNLALEKAWADRELGKCCGRNSKSDSRESKEDRKERCRMEFPTVDRALSVFAKVKEWQPGCWRMALSIRSEEGLDDLAKKSWHDLAPILAEVTDCQTKVQMSYCQQRLALWGAPCQRLHG